MGRIILIVCVLILLAYFVYGYIITQRKKFYEKINSEICYIYYDIELKNKEFIFNLLQYVIYCDINKISINEFKKGVVNTVAYFQKRNKLTDDIAIKILDIIYEHWIERPWSLYFVDKKIIDSKIII